MSNFFGYFLQVLGLQQGAAHHVGSLRLSASKLNTEFETQLHKTAQFLQTEKIHLRHRLAAIPEDTAEPLEQIDGLVGQLLDEISLGLQTAQNSRETIEKASMFSSARQWEEVIALLERHKGAAELQDQRAKNAIGQFHRIIDGTVSQIELDEVSPLV
ncbi:hypothetical protein [Pseudoprimorskyibacter insulae]|uniref:hypothetical protein n=1 Tax=Pseudoprimorskyibacter insulae TaxID=1695997 RepID=UPI000D55AC2B|nr:hypothetical protein [Pseudoprimorskyibacter insulae]